MSNRRQPVRQTRTNPARNALPGSRTHGGHPSHPNDKPSINPDPGFFPGLQHFTDSISALPKELVRHYTMLKEVDAKVFGPEETLIKLVQEVVDAPDPPPPQPVP